MLLFEGFSLLEKVSELVETSLVKVVSSWVISSLEFYLWSLVVVCLQEVSLVICWVEVSLKSSGQWVLEQVTYHLGLASSSR